MKDVCERILGHTYGVQFKVRESDKAVFCQILVEDDEYWHESGDRYHSLFVDELINQLQKAKQELESNSNFVKLRYGYYWNGDEPTPQKQISEMG